MSFTFLLLPQWWVPLPILIKILLQEYVELKIPDSIAIFEDSEFNSFIAQKMPETYDEFFRFKYTDTKKVVTTSVQTS